MAVQRRYRVDSFPTATRLPPDVRRLIDWLALQTGTTPSMIIRAFIEEGLQRCGFQLVKGITEVEWPERDAVLAWMAGQENTDGPVPS